MMAAPKQVTRNVKMVCTYHNMVVTQRYIAEEVPPYTYSTRLCTSAGQCDRGDCIYYKRHQNLPDYGVDYMQKIL